MYFEEIKDKPVEYDGQVYTLVRGLPYQCPDDWEEVLKSLDDNSHLYLIKELDNQKDELAIAAYLDDRRIGYVSSDDNCKVWMFITDEKTPCKIDKKYDTSFRVTFESPKVLFENLDYEDIYRDKDGWIEENLPNMDVPFLRDPWDDAYDWYKDTILIKDFEEFIPDFRRKLASKMITFIARKNTKGDYRYYLPYINAAVAVVDDEELKGAIDTDGFIIAIPELSFKTYTGAIHVNLNVASLQYESPLLMGYGAVSLYGKKEVVFYLDDFAEIKWS